jgi:uncharacterized protein YbjT (DUF2867 family)
MSGKNLILVTGASGRTGRAVVSALKKRNVTVRAYIRRSEVAVDMKRLGADEVILGDLFDFDILDTAIADCSEVIHICPPMNPREAELAKEITNLCSKNSVRRLVLYSVLHPLLSKVRHHHLKLKAEEYLINSGQNYTILQPGRYMQHHALIWKEIIETGKHRMPFSINVKFNIVDVADVAEAAAIILTGDGHDAATYQLAGPESLSQLDMSKIISEVIGKPISAEAKSISDFEERAKKAGMNVDRIEQLVAMNRHYDEHGLIGNSNILEWILGRSATKFSSYIRDNLA